MRRLARIGLPLVIAAASALPRPVVAQSIDPGSTFRVFLATGQTLVSYGEAARVGERVIFTLMVGDGSPSTRYQLMSLPATAVDLTRTEQYSYAVRALRYAATRGETDYAAMTAEVTRALDELMTIEEPKRRLSMAEEARRRLVNWSRDNYGYRAGDVRELAALFEEVIAQMRAAAGESRFTIDLAAGPPPAPDAVIQRRPTFREGLDQAFAAAAASDVSTDRRAILRAVAATVAELPPGDAVRTHAEERLESEREWDRAYAALAASTLEQADAAVEKGDVAGIERARSAVIARDRTFGSRRPEEMQALMADLDTRLERARVRAERLDAYRRLRPALLTYENQVRPVLNTLDGATPSLSAIRESSGPGIFWLDQVEANLKRVQPKLAQLKVPAELNDVHSTLRSALSMAIEACRRRRVSMAARDAQVAGEASAAAAGAMMLAEHARRELLTRLYPPK
jgi:hypothetical protein